MNMIRAGRVRELVRTGLRACLQEWRSECCACRYCKPLEDNMRLECMRAQAAACGRRSMGDDGFRAGPAAL